LTPTVKTLLLALFSLTASGFAEPPKPEAKPPTLPQGVRMERDLSYIPDGDPAQRLDLYLPEQPSDKPLPLIVHIHGGGWKGGKKRRKESRARRGKKEPEEIKNNSGEMGRKR